MKALLNKIPTPKTDAARFRVDRGEPDALYELAADFERRINKALASPYWECVGPVTGSTIRRILTRSTSRKPSVSQNKPKAANRRAKR